MNNNLKLINLISHLEFNNWFNPLIVRETTLNELSLKSSLWSNDFCSIQDIILRLNKNLVAASSSNNSLSTGAAPLSNELNMNYEIDEFIIMPASGSHTRKLNLFNEDQIENLINNQNYCNIKFICVNLKNLFWRLDVFNLCIKLKMRKQPHINCVYYKLSYECSLNS